MGTLLEKSLTTFTDHTPVLTLTYFVYVMSFVIKIKFIHSLERTKDKRQETKDKKGKN